jgi:hypothetical protein
MDSIIRLACIIHQTDCWRHGRTLDRLRIDQMSVSELTCCVNEGVELNLPIMVLETLKAVALASQCHVSTRKPHGGHLLFSGQGPTVSLTAAVSGCTVCELTL